MSFPQPLFLVVFFATRTIKIIFSNLSLNFGLKMSLNSLSQRPAQGLRGIQGFNVVVTSLYILLYYFLNSERTFSPRFFINWGKIFNFSFSFPLFIPFYHNFFLPYVKKECPRNTRKIWFDRKSFSYECWTLIGFREKYLLAWTMKGEGIKKNNTSIYMRC